MAEPPKGPPHPSRPGQAPPPGASDGRLRVQCPNCCRLAPVVRQAHGLLFFECELCGATGATPE